MNRKGIAVAADSTGTLIRRSGNVQSSKSFDTLHKLFLLPGTQSISIMFYGNADFMDIPWETIIKMYRSDRTFPTVRGYAESFLEYLGKFQFSQEQYDTYIVKTAHRLGARIATKTDNEIEAWISQNGSITKHKANSLLNGQFELSYKIIQDLSRKTPLTSKKRRSLVNKYSKLAIQTVQKALAGRTLSAANKKKIAAWVVNACCINPDTFTGIVFAGFGDDEYYPSYLELDVKGCLDGFIAFKEKGSGAVSNKNDVIVRPFAEADDVVTFLRGISPKAQSFVSIAFEQLLQSSLPSAYQAALTEELNLSSKQQEKLLKLGQSIGKGAYMKFESSFLEFQNNMFTVPLFTMARHLTPDLLGRMAETLINLVSFRQEMSFSSETVGGPIDVAVITKAEGLTWVKHKKGEDK